MKENLETRVGYKAVSILKDELETYIRESRPTTPEQHGQKVYYIEVYKQYIEYLKPKEE